jgi:hypothetical protein
MLTEMPWDRAPHLPWRAFTSPLAKWAAQPSFVIGEYLFFGCALAALWHALRQGEERDKHLIAWVGALLAGTANDVFFMALPVVDNFWQAQATIMITPRLPLYIPCVYVCFMYFPTVAAWRMNLPALPRAALAGLATGVFYAPYDVVGARFLWWTWHDTDKPIANRILGAPIGSTMFTMTFVAAFALLVSRAVEGHERRRRRAILGLFLTCALSTPLMMLQMTALQRLDGGIPGIRGLVAVAAIYAAVAWTGLRRSAAAAPRPPDRILLTAAVVYFAALTLIMAAFDPKSHESVSVHQTVGPCYEEATDIAGLTRFKYLCVHDYDEPFSLDCGRPLPAQGSAWYAVCGRAHDDFPRMMIAIGALGVCGMLLFAHLLGPLRRRRTKM